MDAFNCISLIASICSIVGLPLAIGQILIIKSRVEASEEGIRKILNLKDREKLEHILNTLSGAQDLVREMQKLEREPGKSAKALAERSTEVLKELDHSIFELPVSESEIEITLKSCSKEIQQFQKNDVQADHLSEASDYLYSSIGQIKQALAKHEEKEITMASHS